MIRIIGFDADDTLWRNEDIFERAHERYRALLARPDIDGVVIVVPDHLHYPIARAALLAGKDVYLEKPMTYTIDEAAKLHDHVQQTGRMLQVGGSGLNSPLHQKLHEATGFADHRENTDDPLEVQYAPVHDLRLAEGGMLAAIAGGLHARVNSLHGQGVARLGDGLVVEAIAPDGAIEAFRGASAPGFLLGVQWHPEWQVTRNPFYLGILRAFGDACRAYAARRARACAAALD